MNDPWRVMTCDGIEKSEIRLVLENDDEESLPAMILFLI
jgi:hypothetical protein